MKLANYHIIQKLQKEILPLEGLKMLPSDLKINLGLSSLEAAFPNKSFPVGCLHEFIFDNKDHSGAAYGFLSFLLSKFMKTGGIALWIGREQSIFPGALRAMGIDPDQVIFIYLKNEKDILFTIEEALKCASLAAVVGEVNNLDFKQSRRLQLAAGKSRVTAFVLRQQAFVNGNTSSVSRWHISSLPSNMASGMPGVGFPRWQIELQKIRNGMPGLWTVEWRPGGIQEFDENRMDMEQTYHLKTG